MAKKSKSQKRLDRLTEEALKLGLKNIRKIVANDRFIDEELMERIFKQKLPHSDILEGFKHICGGLFPILIATVDISLNIDECTNKHYVTEALFKASYIMNNDESLKIRRFITEGYKKFEDLMIDQAEKIIGEKEHTPKTLIESLFITIRTIKNLVSQVLWCIKNRDNLHYFENEIVPPLPNQLDHFVQVVFSEVMVRQSVFFLYKKYPETMKTLIKGTEIK